MNAYRPERATPQCLICGDEGVSLDARSLCGCCAEYDNTRRHALSLGHSRHCACAHHYGNWCREDWPCTPAVARRYAATRDLSPSRGLFSPWWTPNAVDGPRVRYVQPVPFCCNLRLRRKYGVPF